MSVSEREVRKEMLEHPWANRETALRIVLDHKRRKTTTKEGKRAYMKDYMRARRQVVSESVIPNLSEALGIKGIKMEQQKRRRY